MIGEFIVQYWLEVLFGTFSGIMTIWCTSLNKKLKQRKLEQDSLKSGMIAILHDCLHRECNKYLLMGYIPVDKSEEILDNVKVIYDAYHGIGGNGTGTTVYEKFLKLQIKGSD